MQKITAKNKKAVIMGCSRIGSLLARKLTGEGIDVVVVDVNLDSFTRLSDYQGRLLLGDGTDVDVLKTAGIENADIFVTATDRDNANLMSAQIARGIFGVKNVICLVKDPGRASVYADLGLDTVSSTQITANIIFSSLVESRTLKRFQLGNGSGVALELKMGREVDGRRISDLNIEDKLKISAVIRGLNVLPPDEDLILKTGDHLFGVVLSEEIKFLETALDNLKNSAFSTAEPGEEE